MTLTYRPIALLLYLVYRAESALLGHLLLLSLSVTSLLVFFALVKRLADARAAWLATLLYSTGYLYYEAGHKINNATAELSTLLVLLAVWLFVRSRSAPATPWLRILSYLAYALSLLTYETTLGAFVIIAMIAGSESSGQSRWRRRIAVMAAARASVGYALLSAGFVVLNFVSPVRAVHLKEHALGFAAETPGRMVANGLSILKNTLAWTMHALGPGSLTPLTMEMAAVSALTVAAITSCLYHRDEEPSRSQTYPFLACLGAVWFALVTVPGAAARYFDYRQVLFPYAGLAIAATAVSTIVSRFYGSRMVVGIAAVLTLFIAGNLSLSAKMTANLLRASRDQESLISFLAPYMPKIPETSVVAIDHDRLADPRMPYPVQHFAFAQDYAFKEAIRYHFDRSVRAASLFVVPAFDGLTLGRFAFAQVHVPYPDVVLIDFHGDKMNLVDSLSVSGNRVPLPLSAALHHTDTR